MMDDDGGEPLIARQPDDRRRRAMYGKRPRDPERAAEYAARAPEPNYSQFGRQRAQYVDQDGREYRLAAGEARDALVRAGDIQRPDYAEPSVHGRRAVGRQLFWVRIPIRLRGSVDFPPPRDHALSLYFVRDQVLCRGVTDGVYYTGPRKRSGSVVLRDFVTLGQVADPRPYERVVDVVAPRKRPRS